MALPDGSRELGDLPFRTGITLGIGLSSDFSFSVEVQRMTSGSTWETADVLSGLGAASFHGRWTDVLPLDNLLRTYRARSIAPGWQPSSWTGTVARRPVRLSLNMPKPIPLGGQGVGASLFFQRSSATVKVGTDQASSYVTKTLRIPAAEFVPETNGDSWLFGTGFLANGAVGTDRFVAPLLFPPGVTITLLRARLNRMTVGSQADLTMSRGGDAPTQVVSLTSTNAGSTSFTTYTSSALSFLVASSEQYSLSAQLAGSSAGNLGRIAWAEVTYRMPRYDRSY